MQVNMMRSMYMGMDLRNIERVPQIRIHKSEGEGPAYRAAKLTYRESNFSAIALMCDQATHGLDAAACLNSLDITDVIGRAGWRDIWTSGDSIRLPRFEVEVKQLSVTKVRRSSAHSNAPTRAYCPPWRLACARMHLLPSGGTRVAVHFTGSFSNHTNAR
jgi:hypothetical protein